VFGRIRSLLLRPERHATLAQHWELNHRVGDLYRKFDDLGGQVASQIAVAAEAYLGDTRRQLAAMEATLRFYTDESVILAVAAAHEHAEATSTAGRSYTDAELAATVASLRAYAESLAAAGREHTDEATGSATTHVFEAAKALIAERSDQLRVELEQQLAGLRRRINVEMRATPRSAAKARTAPKSGPSLDVSTPDIDPAFYALFEDHFRGASELIATRQAQYVEFLDGLVDDEHPLLDLGCGRGEWLGILRDKGLRAQGVDSNPASVAECQEAGLDVVEGDLFTALKEAADGSLGAISLMQVVEHLPFGLLLQVYSEAARVLRPGGVLIAETPNSLNLQVAATTFWTDPTHQRPLHPEVMHFIAREAGFARTKGLFLNRLGDPTDLSGVDAATRPVLQRLTELIDGPGDFTQLAWTPAAHTQPAS
jgi:SAM-dependent methyltransferase